MQVGRLNYDRHPAICGWLAANRDRLNRVIQIRTDRPAYYCRRAKNESRTTATFTRRSVNMAKHRIYTMSVAKVYPLYLAKVEKKGRTKAEVDQIIRWLTGYTQRELNGQLKKETDFETFFAAAPKLNPLRSLIKGVICGVRIEEIEEPTMREIRYLDKLIDELAKGKTMDKILRKPAEE
jgi:hypothetical protein